MEKCPARDKDGNQCVCNKFHEGHCNNGDKPFCDCYLSYHQICSVCQCSDTPAGCENSSIDTLLNKNPLSKRDYLIKCLGSSTDAKVWAECFVESVKHNPDIAFDEGTMLGWFANAIMNGYHQGLRN